LVPILICILLCHTDGWNTDISSLDMGHIYSYWPLTMSQVRIEL
jgi:hypothetical protein